MAGFTISVNQADLEVGIGGNPTGLDCSIMSRACLIWTCPLVWLQVSHPVISIFTSFLRFWWLPVWEHLSPSCSAAAIHLDCCESPGEAWNAREYMHWEPKEQNSGVSTYCGWAVSLFSAYICCRDDHFYKKLCGSHRALKINSWE